MTVDELVEKVCASNENKPMVSMSNPFDICEDVDCPVYRSLSRFGKDKRGASVQKIIIDKKMGTVSVHGSNGNVYIYQNKRWYNDGVCCRGTVESELKAWPGYITAVEDLLSGIKINEIEKGFSLDEREARCREWELKIKKLKSGSFLSWLDSNPSTGKPYPKQVESINNVKRLEVTANIPWHVYFLTNNGKVVYVGQTRAVWPSRIEQHLNEGEKIFDDVFYIPVDKDKINNVEYYYINKFKPIYNKQKMAGGGVDGTNRN